MNNSSYNGSKKRPFNQAGPNNDREEDAARLFGNNPIQEDAEAGMSQARPTANFGGGGHEAEEDNDFDIEESKENHSEEGSGDDL
jgi:hypothetical protein